MPTSIRWMDERVNYQYQQVNTMKTISNIPYLMAPVLFAGIIVDAFNQHSILRIAETISRAPCSKIGYTTGNVASSAFSVHQRQQQIKNLQQRPRLSLLSRTFLFPSRTSLNGIYDSCLTALVGTTFHSTLFAKIALACFIPTLLGYYRREYGVSYAYGLATSISALLLLFKTPHSLGTIPVLHASGIAFYGIRLAVFLAYRQTFIPKFKDFVEKIEERATERGGRLSRTPFIMSCSILYLGLVSPLILTSQFSSLACTSVGTRSIVQILIATMWS
jgi:hypothetical protein